MIKITCIINGDYVERVFNINSKELVEFIRENELDKHGNYILKVV